VLRGAIVGYGFIASEGHHPAYLERGRSRGDVAIVAVADGCEARRRAAVVRDPRVRVYPDHQTLFAAEQDLDFVDIATPPADHARVALAALARDLHVMCEKPLATRAGEARQLLDAARSKKRVLFPCHNYLHAPVVRAVRGILDGGLLGRVHMVTLQTFRRTHARGARDWRPDWRRERAIAGGGIAMDHGSHTFYLAFDWLRAYPTQVTATMSTRGTFDTEDDFSCALKFPTGVAHAHLTWNAGVRKVVYTLHGDRGALHVTDDQLEITWTANDRTRSEKHSVASNWMDASHTRWFGSLFEQFRSAMVRGDWTGKDAHDALKCVELIETAYASAQNGSRELALEPSAPQRLIA
jgi:predicted dehydrogenase